jgi:hypothetical protein
MIKEALKKHQLVRYFCVAGNHFDLAHLYFQAYISAYFKDEPRVIVEENPALHQYFTFGKVILGFHHGHTTKMERLPEVMAWDMKQHYSNSDYRYYLTGHLHHSKVIDSPICKVESFRNLTNNDAWATGAGYRGHKEAVAITYSKEYGEVNRCILPIKML